MFDARRITPGQRSSWRGPDTPRIAKDRGGCGRPGRARKKAAHRQEVTPAANRSLQNALGHLTKYDLYGALLGVH